MGEMVRVGEDSPGLTARDLDGQIQALLDGTHDHLRAYGEDAAAAWPPQGG
jgi:hypothetical protein